MDRHAITKRVRPIDGATALHGSATYVLASTLALLALLAFWEPMPGVVWRVESSAARAAI
jgi:hypothetical protein